MKKKYITPVSAPLMISGIEFILDVPFGNQSQEGDFESSTAKKQTGFELDLDGSDDQGGISWDF